MKFFSIHNLGFIGILLATISIFLIVPLFTKSVLAHFFLQSFFTLSFLSIIFLLRSNLTLVFLGSILVILFILFNFLSFWDNSIHYLRIGYSFYVIYVAIAIWVLLTKLFRTKHININLIFCAITIYLLAGILWGKIYFLTNASLPNSFHAIPSLTSKTTLIEAYQVQFDLLYFSYTTLATLGLGDIYPMQHLTKSMTLLEAIFGQLFIAIVISKMVGLWSHNQEG